MTSTEYQKFAAQGILPAGQGKDPLVGFALGLAGESGEVVDAIKKRVYHGRDVSDEHIIEELGDVLWYVTNLATTLGCSIEKLMNLNYEKLTKRYPQMYNKENK